MHHSHPHTPPPAPSPTSAPPTPESAHSAHSAHSVSVSVSVSAASALPSIPVGALLDETLLSEIASLQDFERPGFVDHLFALYFAKVEDALCRLQQATHRGDFSEALRSAHQLRGSSAAVGAVFVSDVFAEITHLSKANNAAAHNTTCLLNAMTNRAPMLRLLVQRTPHATQPLLGRSAFLIHPTQRRLFQDDPRLSQEASAADDRADLPVAKLARSLVQLRISGTLCTLDVSKLDNQDRREAVHCTMMPYVSDERGNPIIKLSHDELHYQYLERYDEASIVITPLCPRFVNPNHTPLPRLNLITTPQDVSKFTGFVDMFAKAHPKSAQMEKPEQKYSYIRLNVDRAIWKSSTAATTEVDIFAYRATDLDPVLSNSRHLLTHLNERYHDWICKFTQSKDAFIHIVDQRGFNVLSKPDPAKDEWQDNRILFETAAQSEEECRWRIESLIQPS